MRVVSRILVQFLYNIVNRLTYRLVAFWLELYNRVCDVPKAHILLNQAGFG